MIILLMGPTGSGKTTIGKLLAAQMNWEFADGDSFHSPANIEKMSRSIPLTDSDRAPWLAAMRDAIVQWIADRANVVLACSALKHAYREQLRAGPEVKIVYLKGSYELFRQRILGRHGHFAGEGILAGQFGDLQEPADAVTVDAAHTPEEIVAEIRTRLGLA